MTALNIVERLREAGYLAYWVGGCVRDLLLGRDPKDYDIATSARPDEVLALYPDAMRVGAHFGVVLVEGVEVATFRSDQAYSDGRRPDAVVFEKSPEADAARRDFTINGMFLDPVSGDVLDFVGGRADLAAGIVRAIGDPLQRFAEDHLRLLRAVRFAARFGFVLDEETCRAMVAQAASIRLVAAERVRDELTRILTEGGASAGFAILRDTGLLVQVLPEIAAMEGVEQPPEFHPEGDVWTHTLLMLAGLRAPSVTLAWGVLLHDVGKPPTFRRAERIRFDGHASVGARMSREMLGRLRFSADEIDQVVNLVTHHLDWMHVQSMRPSTLRRFLRLPLFHEHQELHRLDCESSHRRLKNYEFVRAQLATLSEADLRPVPLLTGHDLIAAGLVPGPTFSAILTEIENAQLDGRVQTREEALRLALDVFRQRDCDFALHCAVREGLLTSTPQAEPFRVTGALRWYSLPMSTEFDSNRLVELAKRLSQSGLRANQFLELFGYEHQSRTVFAMVRECQIHLAALALINQSLLNELMVWAALQQLSENSYPDLSSARALGETHPLRERLASIGNGNDKLAWELSLESIERCIQAVGIDNSDTYFALLKTIVDSLVSLAGGGIVRDLHELGSAIEKVIGLGKIESSDHRTTSKTILRLELFMSACLTTCQYAVAQVTAITRRSDQAPSFHLSMEQLKDSVMATARSEVVDAIGNARRQLVAAELEGEGSMKPYNAGVSFPSHGFWPWTEVFEDPVI